MTIENCRLVANIYAHLASEALDGFERSIMIQISDRLRRLARHKAKTRRRCAKEHRQTLS